MGNDIAARRLAQFGRRRGQPRDPCGRGRGALRLSAGPVAVLILAAAALLEAGGDALVRRGLHAGHGRAGLIALGGVVLLGYGVLVNTPAWDFGRLLGVYVAIFFVTAQVINLVAFHVRPAAPTWAGGALIVAGGLLMTVWR